MCLQTCQRQQLCHHIRSGISGIHLLSPLLPPHGSGSLTSIGDGHSVSSRVSCTSKGLTPQLGRYNRALLQEGTSHLQWISHHYHKSISDWRGRSKDWSRSSVIPSSRLKVSFSVCCVLGQGLLQRLEDVYKGVKEGKIRGFPETGPEDSFCPILA